MGISLRCGQFPNPERSDGPIPRPNALRPGGQNEKDPRRYSRGSLLMRVRIGRTIKEALFQLPDHSISARLCYHNRHYRNQDIIRGH